MGRVNRTIRHMVAAGMGQLTSAMKISLNRSSIAQLFTRDVAPRPIAERLKVLPGTVYKIVEQFKELGHAEERKVEKQTSAFYQHFSDTKGDQEAYYPE